MPDGRSEMGRCVEPGSLEFLDKELFTDLTAGDRHEVDLLVKCRFRGADLSGSVLAQLTMTDCEVQTSNWANVRSDGGAVHLVTFSESLMTGFAVTDGEAGHPRLAPASRPETEDPVLQRGVREPAADLPPAVGRELRLDA